MNFYVRAFFSNNHIKQIRAIAIKNDKNQLDEDSQNGEK